jgi:hypothetical protein
MSPAATIESLAMALLRIVQMYCPEQPLYWLRFVAPGNVRLRSNNGEERQTRRRLHEAAEECGTPHLNSARSSLPPAAAPAWVARNAPPQRRECQEKRLSFRRGVGRRQPG